MDETRKNFLTALCYLLEREGSKAQARLAKTQCIDPGYLNAIIKGRKPGSPEVREKIANHFELHYEDLLSLGRFILLGGAPERWREEPPGIIVQGKNSGGDAVNGSIPVYSVPLISWVQAGDQTEVVDNSQPGYAEKWVATTGREGPNSFALRVVGDSMEPEFKEGEILIVDPSIKPIHGCFVIATNGKEATFKQIIFDGGIVFLRPLNDKYPTREIKGEDLKIVGVVIQKVKEYRE